MRTDQTGMPMRPPAGWYQDPSGQPGLRWWDGSQWTGHTQPGHETEASAPQSSMPSSSPGPGRSGVHRRDIGSKPRGLRIGGRLIFNRTQIGAAVLLAIVLLVLANLHNSGGSAGTAGGAAAVAQPAPHCYYSVQDTLGGDPFTVAILGVSDCANYAVGDSEFMVLNVNVPKGAGNAICMGEDRGQEGSVITTPDNYDAGEAYCQSSGWTDLPSGN